MLEYLESGFASALWQMVSGVLSFVFVAYILHAVGTKLKANMAAFLGKVYRIVVIPGEFVRNVGISLACMITRVKVRRHIITTDATGSYVSITHSRIEAGTPAGFIRNLVILTAPIWFGCVVIGVIALIAGGTGLIPDVKGVMPSEDIGVVSYVTAVFAAAVTMLLSFVCVWHWTSPFCLFCLMCFVSIATEITIDTRGIWAIKAGLFGIFVGLIFLNAIPGISTAISSIGRTVRPVLFGLQATLIFVAMFDFVAALIFGGLNRVTHNKSKKTK